MRRWQLNKDLKEVKEVKPGVSRQREEPVKRLRCRRVTGIFQQHQGGWCSWRRVKQGGLKVVTRWAACVGGRTGTWGTLKGL